jgi:hypothetical protein
LQFDPKLEESLVANIVSVRENPKNSVTTQGSEQPSYRQRPVSSIKMPASADKILENVDGSANRFDWIMALKGMTVTRPEQLQNSSRHLGA